MNNQSDTEDGGVESVEDGGGGGARYGPSPSPLSPATGELGSRERDCNGRLRSTIEKSSVAVAGPATIGSRKTSDACQNDTCVTGDGDGQVRDATATNSREPNCNIVLPAAEGELEEIADDGDGDGVGGPETTALAALALPLSVVDNSCPRGELSCSGDVAGTEAGGACHSESLVEVEASLRSELDGNGSHNWRASASPETEKVFSSETSPASSAGTSSADTTGTVAIGDDCEQDGGEEVGEEVVSAVGSGSDEAMGADDFLPLFALVLVSCVEALCRRFVLEQWALRVKPRLSFCSLHNSGAQFL